MEVMPSWPHSVRAPGRLLSPQPAAGHAVEPLEPRTLLASVPAGFSDSLVAEGLSSPTAFDFAPDGRVFLAEQSGVIRVVKNGRLLDEPFVTLPNVDSSGERGLLGVALDPGFASNGYLYAYYTTTSGSSHNRLVRYTAAGDVAHAASARTLLDLPPVGDAIWHMGGALDFAADGKLLIGVGDHLDPATPQDLTNPLGKILRINPDGSIPADNPFHGQTTGVNRAIWAIGLRNPFSAAVQPGTGRYYINDVGSSTAEEINLGAPGANYGYPATEGPSADPAHTDPVYSYDTTVGRAITGGAFYNPQQSQFPASYQGTYFFADFSHAWIRVLDPANGRVSFFADQLSYPTGLGVGPDGTLWYISRGDDTGGLAEGLGALRQIRYTAGQKPVISAPPADVFAAIGQPATFDVSVSGGSLRYQWQRNGQNISGATKAAFTLASVTAADAGARFRCIVSNSVGSVTSDEATLTVTTSTPPSATITAPAAAATYAGGQVVAFAGGGSDAEDGALAPAALTWRIDFHHADHSHPFLAPTSGIASGTVTLPTVGETAADVFYRIHLTVHDSSGLTSSTFRDIAPIRATATFASDPAGLPLTLDGKPLPTPATVLGVAGIERSLAAPPQQIINGETWSFDRWSDGVADAERTLAFPAADAAYVAVYRRSVGVGSAPLALEAESGALAGGAVIASAVPGFTGGGYLEFPAAKQSAAWTLAINTAGTFALDHRYLNAGEKKTKLQVLIKGKPPKSIKLLPGTSWQDGAVLLKFRKPGTYTITLRSSQPAPGLLDALVLRPVT